MAVKALALGGGAPVQPNGFFLPLASLLSNLSIVTPRTGQFTRNGVFVQWAGLIDIRATANGQASFEITLPITPAAFVALENCSGWLVTLVSATGTPNFGSVVASVGNSRALVNILATTNGPPTLSWMVGFSYRL